MKTAGMFLKSIGILGAGTIAVSLPVSGLLSGCGSQTAEAGDSEPDAAVAAYLSKMHDQWYAQCFNISQESLEQMKQEYRDVLGMPEDILRSGTVTYVQIDHSGQSRSFTLGQPPKIEIFVRRPASQAQVDELGNRIKAMPEVDSLQFISKDEALQKLQNSLGDRQDLMNGLQGNPLPASYIVILKDPDQLEAVAERFFDDPVVDNTPGTHDGVKFPDPENMRRQNQAQRAGLQDFIDNARSCDESP